MDDINTFKTIIIIIKTQLLSISNGRKEFPQHDSKVEFIYDITSKVTKTS